MAESTVQSLIQKLADIKIDTQSQDVAKGDNSSAVVQSLTEKLTSLNLEQVKVTEVTEVTEQDPMLSYLLYKQSDLKGTHQETTARLEWLAQRYRGIPSHYREHVKIDQYTRSMCDAALEDDQDLSNTIMGILLSVIWNPLITSVDDALEQNDHVGANINVQIVDEFLNDTVQKVDSLQKAVEAFENAYCTLIAGTAARDGISLELDAEGKLRTVPANDDRDEVIIE